MRALATVRCAQSLSSETQDALDRVAQAVHQPVQRTADLPRARAPRPIAPASQAHGPPLPRLEVAGCAYRRAHCETAGQQRDHAAGRVMQHPHCDPLSHTHACARSCVSAATAPPGTTQRTLALVYAGKAIKSRQNLMGITTRSIASS